MNALLIAYTSGSAMNIPNSVSMIYMPRSPPLDLFGFLLFNFFISVSSPFLGRYQVPTFLNNDWISLLQRIIVMKSTVAIADA